MPSPRLVRFALPAVLAVVAVLGCDDPTKGQPKAVVLSAAPAALSAAPPASAAVVPASLGSATYDVDPAQSKLGFIGSKVTMSHAGNFEKFTGSITLADGKPEGGKLRFEIDLASAKTDQAKLDEHLKGKDFFNAEKYPKATFVSSKIETGGQMNATHTITGELDLHGVKKTLQFPATIKVEHDAITGTADFAINRKDFDIVYKGKLDDLIRDDVLIKIALKAPTKK